DRGRERAEVVGLAAERLERRVVGPLTHARGDVGPSAGRYGREVVALVGGVGAAETERGDPSVDEAGVGRAERRRVDAEAGGVPRAQIVDEDVGRVEKGVEVPTVGVALRVEDDAALVRGE